MLKMKVNFALALFVIARISAMDDESKNLKEVPISHKHLENSSYVDLDIYLRQPTHKFDFEWTEGVDIYTVNNRYRITRVRYRLRVIWETKALTRKNWVTRVQVYRMGCLRIPKYVSLFFANGEMREFEIYGFGFWREIKKSVVIDINKKGATFVYRFKEKDGRRLYSVADGYSITKVVGSWLFLFDRVIWEQQKNHVELGATNVIVEKSLDGKKRVMIVFPGMSFLVFLNQSLGTWANVTKQLHKPSELWFIDNDEEVSNTKMTKKISGLSFCYEFDEEVRCQKIMYNSYEIWNWNNGNKYDGYPCKVCLELSTNKLFATFTNGNKTELAIPEANSETTKR